MAKVELIRKNILTDEYEHAVESRDTNGDVTISWAPGYTGYDWISNEQQVIDDIRLGNIKISENMNGWDYLLSYADYSKNIYGDYEFQLLKQSYYLIDYMTQYDIGIRELQDEKKPLIISSPETNTTIKNILVNNTLKALIGSNLNFAVAAVNPIYDLDINMNYNWKLNGEDLSTNKSIFVANSVDDSGVINCEIENEAGLTKTTKIKLEVYNPKSTTKFYSNLIKNGNASEGLANWTIYNGYPEVVKIGQWPNQLSDMYYNESYYNRSWLGSYGERNEPFGPAPSVLLNGSKNALDNGGFYFRGGSAGNNIDGMKNRLVTMKQDIDLSNVIDYIDRKVYGVNDVYGCLFGWLGSMGQACGLIQDNQSSWGWSPRIADGINDEPINMSGPSVKAINLNGTWTVDYDATLMMLDRVYVEVKIFDERNEELDTDYIMYSPFHMGEDYKFFLRCQHLYIPIGARRIELWVKFSKCENAIYKPFKLTDTKLVNVGDMEYEPTRIIYSHTTSVQNLNLHLYVNDTDENFNKINQFKRSTHFSQYDMKPTAANQLLESDITDSYMLMNNNISRISEISQVIENRYEQSYSAIHLKTLDLYKYNNLRTFDSIYNHILSLTWFTKRFEPDAIWNAILEGITVYNLSIDVSNKPLKHVIIGEYDTFQHYSTLVSTSGLNNGN